MLFITQKDYAFKVQCGQFEIQQEEVELVRSIWENEIEYFLTQNYIATSKKLFWDNSSNNEVAEKLSGYLEKIFLADFSKPFAFSKHTFGTETTIDENSMLVNPDISYLNWAIKNVDSFTINPEILNETFTIKQLKSFKTNRLNKTIFEYEPIIESFDYRFPEQIQTLNQQKFEKENKVEFDKENGLLVPDMTNGELILKYGFYLNETYTSPDSSNDDFEDYNSSDDYCDSNDSDDWLINAAGTDDPETMNDVYWNLD